MSRGGRYPRITCTGCGRNNVPVSPTKETVFPHDNPTTQARCDASGQRIDLYGPDVTPAGGDR